MKSKTSLILAVFISLMLMPLFASGKEVVGWVEQVTVEPGSLPVKAKIDSGAKTTSLHCDCQQIYDKYGEQWMRFTITNYKGNHVTMECKVERIAKIKRHFGEVQERAVIKLGVCLANVYKEIDANVIDRSGLNYQMLIGRNFLASEFLIDSGATFTRKP